MWLTLWLTIVAAFVAVFFVYYLFVLATSNGSQTGTHFIWGTVTLVLNLLILGAFAMLIMKISEIVNFVGGTGQLLVCAVWFFLTLTLAILFISCRSYELGGTELQEVVNNTELMKEIRKLHTEKTSDAIILFETALLIKQRVCLILLKISDFNFMLFALCPFSAALGLAVSFIVNRRKPEDNAQDRKTINSHPNFGLMPGLVLGLLVALYFADVTVGGEGKSTQALLALKIVALCILLGYQAPYLWKLQEDRIKRLANPEQFG